MSLCHQEDALAARHLVLWEGRTPTSPPLCNLGGSNASHPNPRQSQTQEIALSQPLLLPSCRSPMLHLKIQARGDLGTGVPLSIAGSHSGAPC